MKNPVKAATLLTLLFAGGCTQFSSTPVATPQYYNPVNSYQEYLQRSDKATLSAGDAQETNNRIQEIDPWPRNAGNNRIATNGDRMAEAVYRYRCGRPAPAPLPTTTTSTYGNAATAAVSGASSAGRPGTDCAGTTAPVGGANQ